MKTLVVVTAGLWLAACASVPPAALEEYYYVDQEYGVAQQHSFDQQVAFPEAGRDGAVPDGLEGIHSEGVMGVHNSTFGEKPTEVPVLSFGIAEE